MLGSLRNRVPGVARLGRWARRGFHMTKYAIAIDLDTVPAKFSEFVESFAPRFSLRCGVHLLYHPKKLSLVELRELVRPTLPEGTGFWVCVAPEDEYVPTQEPDAAKRDTPR